MLPTFRLVNRFAGMAASFLGHGAPPAPTKCRGRCDYTEFNQFWKERGVNLRYVDNLCPSGTEGDSEPFVLSYLLMELMRGTR